jgi:hypothetical protein
MHILCQIFECDSEFAMIREIERFANAPIEGAAYCRFLCLTRSPSQATR